MIAGTGILTGDLRIGGMNIGAALFSVGIDRILTESAGILTVMETVGKLQGY